ncbi:MAG: DNA polymerase III subunit alpha [Actinomycetales bacterium]|nr:DNA polymerase III subunit alpha [Actinomycetales bacterium]
MSDNSFVHLHVHTDYSMLDGAARVEELFKAAAQQGMPAVAMTDHGNLFGAFEFWKKGIEHGVKPIIGIEGYYAPLGRKVRAPIDFGEAAHKDSAGVGIGAGRNNYNHMTLWAENNVGLNNLFHLSSLASIEGYYYNPRFDRELLQQYGKGIIATTGCPSGEVNRWLQAGNYRKAREVAADMRDILGEGNYFVELMDHGIDIEQVTRADLLKLAKDLGLPLVATNDLHYVHQHDADVHDALLCVQTRSTLSDTKRFKFDGTDFYLKSAQEMRELWSDFPQACDNTLLIAERCEISFTEGRNLMPQFEVPAGHTEDSWLVEQVMAGLKYRLGDSIPEQYLERAKYELEVVAQMGFPGYFLVVADLCRHARETGIRVGPGRGSAAGAVIAWALRITELDPIEHGLYFERFLNPERISMPDIDIDFDERRRSEMIRYATEKYGEDRVAQIVTFGIIKAKAAIRDAARVLGLPSSTADRITKAMPPAVMGKDISLGGIFDPENPRYGEAGEVRSMVESDREVKEIIEMAKGLEGFKRQTGVHAAGVILCNEPLMDVLPVFRREQDNSIITQFDMGACEKLGLLKMDFLGLRNLTVLEDALVNIKRNRNEDVVLEELSLDNKKTYELLARGDTLGVFQLDGGPMRSLLKSMVPTSFEDISAVIALYRPGPMGANAHNDYADYKNKRKPQVPIHPDLEQVLEPILGDTFGLIVYQEQVMEIAQTVAGYSLGQADLLRRAMGKKKAEELAREYIPFQAGMKERGFSDHAIQTLWDKLVPFSDYAFNKAHSAGYGLVSYWTAYLKANYPAEYMAALLTSVKDDKDKSAIYLNECRRMGINVLPPDVNESDVEFSAIGDDIRFGLAAVRNVGENVVESLIASRIAQGRFSSFVDFLNKVDVQVCNKRVIESLIKAGAFDSLGHTRKGLLTVHIDAVDSISVTKKSQALGQLDLFGMFDDQSENSIAGVQITIPEDEWDKRLLLAHEREMLGLYVSDHPLFGVQHVLATMTTKTIAEVAELSPGTTATVGGIISSVQLKTTRSTGSRWAIVQLEDLGGNIEINFYSKQYEQLGHLLNQDSIVLMRIRVDGSDEGRQRISAFEITVPELGQAKTGPLELFVPQNRVNPAMMDALKNVLESHPGPTAVHLTVLMGDRQVSTRLEDSLRVRTDAALFGDLKALLGANCLDAPTVRTA